MALLPKTELLEGDVELRRHGDGRVEILQAPPTARMALEVLQQSDPHVVRLSGNRIRVAEQVTYRVVAWDAHASALLLERDDGPGPGPTTHDEDAAVAAWPAGAGTKGA